jgi:TatA/E family protein of Tat protein translocase
MEIILIVLLVFLLFGANKFPAMMKNLADGVKSFRKEIKETPKPAAKAAGKKSIKKPAKKKK